MTILFLCNYKCNAIKTFEGASVSVYIL